MFLVFSAQLFADISKHTFPNIGVCSSLSLDSLRFAMENKLRCILCLLPPSLTLTSLIGKDYQILSVLSKARIKIFSFSPDWHSSEYALSLLCPIFDLSFSNLTSNTFQLFFEDHTGFMGFQQVFGLDLSSHSNTRTDPPRNIFLCLGTEISDIKHALKVTLQVSDRNCKNIILSMIKDDLLDIHNIDDHIVIQYIPRKAILKLLSRRVKDLLLLEFDALEVILCESNQI